MIRDDFGRIIIHESYGIRGNLEHQKFTWEGPKKTEISVEFLSSLGSGNIYQYRVGDVVQIGPFRLKLYDINYYRGTFLAVRIDYPFWWLIPGRHHVSRILFIAYQRVIMTLAIWGLADYDPTAYLSWRNIKVINTLIRILTNKKHG